MQGRGRGIAVAGLGVFFLSYYLVARLFFTAELDAAVAAAGVHSIRDIVTHLSVPLLLYVVFGYSFKLGMLLTVVGGAMHAGMGKRGLWLLAAGGGTYLATCYVPFVGYSPRYYGLLGALILVLFLFLVRDWTLRRPTLRGSARTAGDLRMVGSYFLVVATWGLCGIFGIVTYALKPETMIARGLRPTALMMTSHVMAELALGWFFLFLASRREAASGPAGE